MTNLSKMYISPRTYPTIVYLLHYFLVFINPRALTKILKKKNRRDGLSQANYKLEFHSQPSLAELGHLGIRLGSAHLHPFVDFPIVILAVTLYCNTEPRPM